VAGAAHLSIALAAKRVAPRVPLWQLVLGSYAIDLVFLGFAAAGFEHMPAPARTGASQAAAVTPGQTDTNPWSHGLAAALLWSALFGALAGKASHDRKRGTFFAALVFSHWLVDLAAKPMTGIFPEDTGLPLLLRGSPTMGLGLYRSRRRANVIEYGSLALGATVYLWTLRSRRRSGERPSPGCCSRNQVT